MLTWDMHLHSSDTVKKWAGYSQNADSLCDRITTWFVANFPLTNKPFTTPTQIYVEIIPVGVKNRNPVRTSFYREISPKQTSWQNTKQCTNIQFNLLYLRESLSM